MSQTLFEQSQLAFAAYADLSPNIPPEDFVARLKQAGFADAQARRFVENYRVVDQYTNAENGLSVTFFEKLSGNPPEQVLAIRGTEFGTDFINDVVIADVMGIGTSPDGRDLAQYQSLRWAVGTWLNGTWLRPGYSIAGHSLGGYLGGVLAGDIGAQAGQAYLYNAPGTMGLLGPLTQTITSRFGLSGWNAPNVTEIEGSAGLSLIAGIGQDFSGNKVIPEIESQTNFFNNHSIVVLTDALAVYALYSELAPSLDISSAGLLLKSASATNKGTLEGALDALRKTLLGANVVATAEENRESLYANLYALQNSAEYRALQGSAALRLTAVQDASTLVTKAKSDFGHFLAVKHLLPVAIEGSSGVLGTVHADLYAQWQADRLLTPEQRKQGQATFTDEYLTDRAAFLAWKNKLALEDADAATTAYNKGGATDQWFRDNASGLTINLGSGAAPAEKRRFIFGADQSSGTETLSGGTQADNLYGGGGDDTLYGYDGHDHLEGNAGNDELYGSDGNDTLVGGSGIDRLEGGKNNDTLKGGAGLDTYEFASGDGWDWIEDADGLGNIRYDGIALGGGVHVATGFWQQKDAATGKTFTYSLDTRTENGETFQVLTIQAPGAGGGIRIKGWQPGQPNQLGITLGEAAPPLVLPPGSIAPATRQTAWHGEDHAVIEDQVGQLLMLSAVGDYGEVQGDGQLIGNGSDNYLYERAGGGSDELYGLGGRDSLIATGGNDRLFGGDDDDVLHGGDDDDLLEGGAGSDVLAGGSGADVLLGGEGADFLFATGSYSAARSDWSFTYDAGTNTLVSNQVFGSPFLADAAADLLRGGAGNDFLFGGEGADQLFGEADDDRLEGAAGDDYLSGGEGADVLRGDMTQRTGTPGPDIAWWYNPPEFHGNDILDGGAGDDRLYGAGGDTYLWGRGDKSQSPGYGGYAAANNCEWRRTA